MDLIIISFFINYHLYFRLFIPITDVVHGLALQAEAVYFKNFVAGVELPTSLGCTPFDHPTDDDSLALVSNCGSL